ncbi:MAG TPA: hypothetical protein VN787_04335 [Steroidobacteraceae bacterium]|nr:hypothetical protein [Steroidobacteraceae bacterium]
MTTPTTDASAAVPAGDLARRAMIRRELVYFGIVGGFGIVLLPFLVYLAGAATLGPYEGGLPSFLGKLYGDFLTLSPAATTLLLGPYLLFQAVRLLTRPLRHRNRRDEPAA